MKLAGFLLLVGACGFSKLPRLVSSDASSDSASAPDSGVCAATSTTCASSDTLRTCSAAGAMAVDTPCSWGCNPTGTAHCGVLQPTGGRVSAVDLDPTTLAALGDITLPSPATIDSYAGTVTEGVGGTGTGINGIEFHIASSDTAVFRMKSLHVTGDVILIGGRMVALVVDGPVTIDGVIDATACGGQSTVGGSLGGQPLQPGGGIGGGKAATSSSGGAGGGGNGAQGGGGGAGSSGAGGSVMGDDAVTILLGGAGGGGGGGTGGSQTLGGNGGGAIQIVTNDTITINTGGGINMGGCGGDGGTANGIGGAGGGAGGTIVLEATRVTIAGGAGLAANGGGGGGGGNAGGKGANGKLTRMPAAGGQSSVAANGGNGGSSPFQVGGSSGGTTVGGGGGGGIGRIRINTATGTASLDSNAILSPNPADSGTTFTEGSAQVH